MGDTVDINLELGRRIREARQSLKLTQRDLGAAIGVTFQQVQKYESGRSRMTVDTLLETAEALKVSPGSLIAGMGATADDLAELSPSERELIRTIRTIPERQIQLAIVALAQSI